MCPHPCGPPHDQCHRHKSSGSSSSSSSSSSSGGSSGGGGSSSSSSGGSSSSSGGGGGSSSNNWHNDGYDNNSSGNDNSVDYNSENYENWSTDGGDWSHDGWDSSNLDTGTSSGVSGLNVAQSVVPFIFGAAMVGLIAAALVVMRVSRFMFLFVWKTTHNVIMSIFILIISNQSIIVTTTSSEAASSRGQCTSTRRGTKEAYEIIHGRYLPKEKGYAR